MTDVALPASFAGGRYRVRCLLGEGGRKRVYLAHDERLDRDVALALVKADGLDAVGLARIHREARAMGRLGDHPHIVTVHDVGDELGQPYIVSQHMAGGDVARLLSEAPAHRLSLADTLSIATGVCRALEHAHASGVIHRDLKPGNVWLMADGTAKLGDFGLALARDHSRLSVEGLMVGTVSYMAPEQVLGRSVDARTDLYALGAMLYEMLAGRPPFVGDDAVAIVSQHIHTAPVVPSWHNPAVPAVLDALIVRLLAKTPAERPASAAAVREALAAVETAAPPAAEPNPLARLASGVFVGREREMAALRASVEEALSGSGRLLLLGGEPGIGKTRTAQELATYAQLRGMQVLWGRCYEGGGAPAYWPWVQALRAYVHERPPQDLLAEMGRGAADIAQVVSAVRERFPELPTPPALEPESARFRLFDSLTTFLKNAAARQPLLVVLDDLHWGDPASLLLLEFLAREMTDARVVVVGTYRDVEVRRQHRLFPTLAGLAREAVSRRMVLGGLGAPDVARYMELTAGHVPPTTVVAAVARETEGNPFFVGEVVRWLVAEGRFPRVGETATDTVGIPPSVREVIGRRLDQLSAECNRALTVAAVVGREFGLDVLERVSDVGPDRLLDVLDEAFAARVVTDAPGHVKGRYSFAHALIRETLYGELTTPRRIRLHREIAETLEAINAARPEPVLAQLAYHFFEAAPGGDVQKAVEYARRAGDRAAAVFAYEDAARHYANALQAFDLLELPEQAPRCELLLALGANQYKVGDRDKASVTFRQALAIARALQIPDLLARAALGLGAPWVTLLAYEVGTSDPAVVTVLEEALSALPAGDTAMRVRLLACLANALLYTSDRERGTALSEQAVAMARRVGDPATLAAALYSRGEMLRSPGGAEARRANAVEILRLAAATGDKEMELHGRDKLCGTLLDLGETAALESQYDAFVHLAEELRAPEALYHAVQGRTLRALLHGHFEAAEALMRETLAVGQRIRNQGSAQGFAVQMAALLREKGRLEELEMGLARFVEQYPSTPAWRCGLALLHAELGREAEARTVFEQLAAKDFHDLPDDWQWLPAIVLLAETCTFLGDAHRAAMLYTLLRPRARCIVTVFGCACYGSASLYLGMLAATMSRWDEATRHFEDALHVNTRLDARPWVARTQHAYASALLARAERGDGEKALALLSAALDTAQALGMKAVGERALALKLRAQGVGSADPRTSIDVVASAVERERPDLRPHAAPDGTVTILFTDIEGSTAIVERLGDQRAQSLLRAHNALVRAEIAAHGGFEVKALGDGFMVVFASARRAVLCAIGLQRALARPFADHPDEHICVRIGLHTGEVIREGDDFFGKNVILAARIAAQARGREILVSSVLKELTESAGDLRFGASRVVELKGLSARRTVFEVRWAG